MHSPQQCRADIAFAPKLGSLADLSNEIAQRENLKFNKSCFHASSNLQPTSSSLGNSQMNNYDQHSNHIGNNQHLYFNTLQNHFHDFVANNPSSFEHVSNSKAKGSLNCGKIPQMVEYETSKPASSKSSSNPSKQKKFDKKEIFLQNQLQPLPSINSLQYNEGKSENENASHSGINGGSDNNFPPGSTYYDEEQLAQEKLSQLKKNLSFRQTASNPVFNSFSDPNSNSLNSSSIPASSLLSLASSPISLPNSVASPSSLSSKSSRKSEPIGTKESNKRQKTEKGKKTKSTKNSLSSSQTAESDESEDSEIEAEKRNDQENGKKGDEEEHMMTQIRKNIHKETEKRRRVKINERLNDLRDLLPIRNKEKMTNKVAILEEAVAYIAQLQGSCNSLVETNRILQDENQKLKGRK